MEIHDLVSLAKEGALIGLFCEQYEGSKAIRAIVETAQVTDSEVGEVIVLSASHSFACEDPSASPAIWAENGPHCWIVNTKTAKVHKAPGVMTISLSGEEPLELE